jgi:DNA polymerase III epsilon subunit family exonuclease
MPGINSTLHRLKSVPLQSTAMKLPRNLVPDSTLVDETFELVRENGGRASFAQITDCILRLSNADHQLAASLVAELIQNDPRFVVEPDHLRAVDDHRDSSLLAETEFVVLDVEAVHDRKIPARIIEVGAYRVRGGEILDEFQTLINAETAVPRFVTGLTGISNDMLTTAPKFADVIGAWLEFIGDAVLVAHNSSFDLPLLNREIARVYPGYRLNNCDLCTVDLARRLVPQIESYKLDSLAAYFGFEIPRRHRAADDALATARVFLRLLNELAINGITTLSEARRFQTKLAAGEFQLALDA